MDAINNLKARFKEDFIYGKKLLSLILSCTNGIVERDNRPSIKAKVAEMNMSIQNTNYNYVKQCFSIIADDEDDLALYLRYYKSVINKIYEEPEPEEDEEDEPEPEPEPKPDYEQYFKDAIKEEQRKREIMEMKYKIDIAELKMKLLEEERKILIEQNKRLQLKYDNITK